jgi:hypothetical protein
MDVKLVGQRLEFRDIMKVGFNVITIVLFLGFIMSLLIPSQKKRGKTTIGGVSSHI